MSTQILVRDVRPDELDAIAMLLKEAYEQYAPLVPREAWDSVPPGYYGCSRQNVRIATHRCRNGRPRCRGRNALLEWVCVFVMAPAAGLASACWEFIQSFRGRGVGKALMDECMRRARDAGLKTIGLHTTTAMDVARRLYEKMGFVRVPEFDFHPDDDVVVMAYRLDL